MMCPGGSVMDNSMTYEYSDYYIVIHFRGEINCVNTSLYRREISELLETSKQDVVFDFREVSFIDSSGIGLVLGRYNQLKMMHRTLALCGLNQVCYRLFELTGLFTIMPYFNTLLDIKEGCI